MASGGSLIRLNVGDISSQLLLPFNDIVSGEAIIDD